MIMQIMAPGAGISLSMKTNNTNHTTGRYTYPMASTSTVKRSKYNFLMTPK